MTIDAKIIEESAKKMAGLLNELEYKELPVFRQEDIDKSDANQLLKKNWSELKNSILVLPLNHPAYMGRGTTSVVFDLGEIVGDEKTSGFMCGKVNQYADKKVYHHNVPKETLYLHCDSVQFSPSSADRLYKTIFSLKKMGFDVPFQEQYGMKKQDRTFYFIICDNLCQGEKYKVEDARGFRFEKLANGKELKEEYESAVEKILDSQKNGYEISYSPHSPEGDVREATEKIFLVQYDAKNSEGRLKIGDLNHIKIGHPDIKGREIKILNG
jgi:hypothetical protein